MAMTKQQVSNQTVGKHFGCSPQTLSDWKRSGKVELMRRYEAFYESYKKYLENKKEEK